MRRTAGIALVLALAWLAACSRSSGVGAGSGGSESAAGGPATTLAAATSRATTTAPRTTTTFKDTPTCKAFNVFQYALLKLQSAAPSDRVPATNAKRAADDLKTKVPQIASATDTKLIMVVKQAQKTIKPNDADTLKKANADLSTWWSSNCL